MDEVTPQRSYVGFTLVRRAISAFWGATSLLADVFKKYDKMRDVSKNGHFCVAAQGWFVVECGHGQGKESQTVKIGCYRDKQGSLASLAPP